MTQRWRRWPWAELQMLDSASLTTKRWTLHACTIGFTKKIMTTFTFQSTTTTTMFSLVGRTLVDKLRRSITIFILNERQILLSSLQYLVRGARKTYDIIEWCVLLEPDFGIKNQEKSVWIRADCYFVRLLFIHPNTMKSIISNQYNPVYGGTSILRSSLLLRK